MTKNTRKRSSSEMQDGSDIESRKKQRTCVQVAKKKDNNKQKETKDGDASSSVTKQDGENSISTEGASTMTVIPVFGETCTVLQSEKENSLAVQISKEGGKTSEMGDVNNADSDSGKIEVMSQLTDTGQTSGAGFAGDTLNQGIPACEKDLTVEMDSESVKEDEATRLITDNSKIVNGGPPRGTVVEESVQNENNESRTDELQVINIEDKAESKEVPSIEIETLPISGQISAVDNCQNESPAVAQSVDDSSKQIIINKSEAFEDKGLTELPKGQVVEKVISDDVNNTKDSLEAMTERKKEETSTCTSTFEASTDSVKTAENSNVEDNLPSKPGSMEPSTKDGDSFEACIDFMDFTSSQLLKIEAEECDKISKPVGIDTQSSSHQMTDPPTPDTSQREERQEDGRAREVMRKMMKDLNEIKLVTGSLLSQMSQYRKHRSQRQPQPSAFSTATANKPTAGQSFQRKSRGSVTSQFKKY